MLKKKNGAVLSTKLWLFAFSWGLIVTGFFSSQVCEFVRELFFYSFGALGGHGASVCLSVGPADSDLSVYARCQ